MLVQCATVCGRFSRRAPAAAAGRQTFLILARMLQYKIVYNKAYIAPRPALDPLFKSAKFEVIFHINDTLVQDVRL